MVDANLVAVHGVQFTDDDLSRLAAAGATVVACPRSNKWTGAGDPPIERFYASGVRVAVGTDSLASVANLNLFEELATLRRLAPTVPATRLLAQRHARWGHGAGVSGGFRLDRARQTRAAPRRPLTGSRHGRGRISGGGIEPGAVTWLES